MIYIADKVNESRSFYYEYDKEALDSYMQALIDDAPIEHKILSDCVLPEVNIKSDDFGIKNLEYHYTYKKKYIDGESKAYPTYDIVYDKLLFPEEVNLIYALESGNYDKFLSEIDKYPNLKEYFHYFVVTKYDRFKNNVSTSVIINNHSKVKELKR